MESKNYDIKKLMSKIKSFVDGPIKDSQYPGFTDSQYPGDVEIYKSLVDRRDQLILECGVNRGSSTSIFTAISEQNNSICYSIDILDCSDVVKSDRWSFFQSDDTDVKRILSRFPKIQTLGIDILYIDSEHTASHVEKVLYAWYPYLNKNSLIFVDDIDSYIYKKGSKKDNIFNEINWEEINKFTVDFARSNRSDVSLVHYFTKTGLAKMHKFSDKGSLPLKVSLKKRPFGLVTFIKLLKKIKKVLFK